MCPGARCRLNLSELCADSRRIRTGGASPRVSLSPKADVRRCCWNDRTNATPSSRHRAVDGREGGREKCCDIQSLLWPVSAVPFVISPGVPNEIQSPDAKRSHDVSPVGPRTQQKSRRPSRRACPRNYSASPPSTRDSRVRRRWRIIYESRRCRRKWRLIASFRTRERAGNARDLLEISSRDRSTRGKFAGKGMENPL